MCTFFLVSVHLFYFLPSFFSFYKTQLIVILFLWLFFAFLCSLSIFFSPFTFFFF